MTLVWAGGDLGAGGRRRDGIWRGHIVSIILLSVLAIVLIVAGVRLIGKSFWMKLSRKVFDCGNDTRRGTVDRIAGFGIAVVADGIQNAPARQIGEGFDVQRRGLRMRVGKNQEFRLKPRDLFETYFRPIFDGVHYGGGASVLKGVGDEGLLADGDERLGPHDKEGATPGKRSNAPLNAREVALEIFGKGFAGLRCTHDFCETLGGGNNGGDRLRVDGVGRNAEIGEGVDGIEAIQTFRYEHEIRMQVGDGFEAGVDGATDLGFALCVGRKIAVIGVADQEILQPERVDRFGQSWSERNDTVRILGDADGAAGFVGDFA